MFMSLFSRPHLWIFAALIGTVFLAAIPGKPRTDQNQALNNEAYSEWFRAADGRLRAKTDLLIERSASFVGRSGSVDSLRWAVAETRLAYKAVEWWSAFAFPEFSEEYLNGAPIIQSARLDNRSFARLPEGLQVLDEAVWEETMDEELKSKTAQDALQFRNKMFLMRNALKDRAPQSGEAAAAMRLGLIRVFSLGLSGFDTPGSANGLAEAASSLKSMKSCVLWLDRDETDSEQIHVRFEKAIQELEEARDFERFDRLAFLMEHIDPLYALLYTPGQQAPDRGWNPESRSIFADDFLNPYFYSELKSNRDSEALKALGKRLFRDTRLSKTGTLSCASCHPSDRAFQDGLPKAISNDAQTPLDRNTPGLMNAVYADRFFYDLRAYTLEQQAEHVIFNEREFDIQYAELLDNLNSDKSLRKEFKAVFGNSKASKQNIKAALGSYVLSLRSWNSPFDRYVRGEAGTLPEEVRQGFNLFMGKAACGTCHFAPNFSGLLPPEFRKSESEVIGVLRRPIEEEEDHRDATLDGDPGRFANGVPSEQLQIHRHSFKTTSVRNSALTAPYFHNGAYPDLASVLRFYKHGGAAGIGIDLPIQTLSSDSLDLTDAELLHLESFIKSLSDVPLYE